MNPKNNKRKTRGSSYFDPLIQRYNGDIFKEKASNLESKIPVLVKDIVKGNVPYEKYGKYFTPELIYYLSEYTRLQHNEWVTINTAMREYSFAHPGSSIVQATYAKTTNRMNAWAILNKNMADLHRTGDVQSMLEKVPHQMKDNYKNSI